MNIRNYYISLRDMTRNQREGALSAKNIATIRANSNCVLK